jgi:hypothetical protein
VGQDSLGTTVENEHNVRRITFSKYQDIDSPIKNCDANATAVSTVNSVNHRTLHLHQNTSTVNCLRNRQVKSQTELPTETAPRAILV